MLSDSCAEQVEGAPTLVQVSVITQGMGSVTNLLLALQTAESTEYFPRKPLLTSAFFFLFFFFVYRFVNINASKILASFPN